MAMNGFLEQKANNADASSQISVHLELGRIGVIPGSDVLYLILVALPVSNLADIDRRMKLTLHCSSSSIWETQLALK